MADSNDAAIVVDAKTGKTLYSSAPDAHRYPASLTKMMTLYLTFEALSRGRISMDTPVPISRLAASQEPSKLYVPVGSSVTVKQAILSLVTRSANDVAVALSELLGGTEDNFARIMTTKAHALGMSRTTFRNANGLPNRHQMTTARDMARLGIALREHFPQYFHFFSTQAFHYKGHTIGNHNHLLGEVKGVDGIKTGFTSASGFNLVTSVDRDNRKVVAVVMGGTSWRSRDNTMKKLLATYVPKASTRGSSDLIARTAPAPTLAAIELPNHGPRPQFRESTTARVALAYAEPMPEDDFPMPEPRPVIGRQALIRTLQQQEDAIAVPAADPGAQTLPQPDAARETAKIDAMTTGSTIASQSGWVIQIGAMPDHAAAARLLRKAEDAKGAQLASAQPFTVVYGNGDTRMYRARFGGFDGKDDAWSACDRLKKAGFACWASEQ
ncbi:serine hydrolase [Pararhizobium mangrovi]|nr:serine hydrolase [Pararhizobium mangrovi]